jgi:hypothetical protein
MSNDYINCETRISEKKLDVCRMDCAFYSMCSKPEKLNPVVNIDFALEVAFKVLEDSAVS